MARTHGHLGSLPIIGVTLALTLVGCTLQNQDAPPLTGPSEFELSLSLTAEPDSITQDGSSPSVITALALDGRAQPVTGLRMRAAIQVGGSQVEFGQLTPREAATDGNGRASFVYVAPPASPFVTEALTVSIVVVPLGSDFANAWPRRVSIQLVPPTPQQSQAPLAFFTFSPVEPATGEAIFFDASGSQAAPGRSIVSHGWNFGKGTTGTGQMVTKIYNTAGTYLVTLVVTDNAGQVGTFSKNVTVR